MNLDALTDDELMAASMGGASRATGGQMPLDDMSDEELMKASLGEGSADRAAAPKPEGRALGFFERHGTEAEAATGVRPSDAYNDPTVGKVMDVAYSVAPFTGTAARAMAGKRQKSLDAAMKTGDASGMFGGMDDALKEWDETEGKKYDLYQRALKGDKDVNYSPIYAKVFDKNSGRYVLDTDGKGNVALDDRYATPKEEARKAYVKQLATEQTRQTAEAKANAAEDLANNTAGTLMNFAHGATASLGFAGEFYLGGALAKGVLGTAALRSTKLGRIANVVEKGKGGLIGVGKRAAYSATQLAAPTIANALARYEELTANDYRMDDMGNVHLAEKGDGAMRGAAKALGGAAFENATEVALGKIVNKVFGTTCKGIYNKVPGVKKLFDSTAGKLAETAIADRAKKAWVGLVKTYATVQKAVHFDLMPVGEFAEEYVQGYGDDVLGFGNRDVVENKTGMQFFNDFRDWDGNFKDVFFGVMGQTIALGLGGHAMNRAHNFKNSVDAKVLGTLKLHGYNNADIATMGTNRRLELANDLSNGKATADMGYAFADYARFAGVKERDIERYKDDLQTLVDKKKFDALDPSEQIRVKKNVLQLNAAVYSAASAFENGIEGATDAMNLLGARMKKAILLMEKRQGLGNSRNNLGTKPTDFQSRVDWTGTTDDAGNINWQTDERGREYIESRPFSNDGHGVRIFKVGDRFAVFHPQDADERGYAADDLKQAHDWAASLDQFAQKKNKDREIMSEYVHFNARRLVPTQTDKKTGEKFGAPVVTANNAQDAVDNFDWLTEGDRRELQNAALNGTEGGGFRTEDGTILIFVDNLRDTSDALLTLAHELGGHMAVKEGAKEKDLSLADTLAEVYETSESKDVGKAKKEYRIRRTEGRSKDTARAIAQEEGMVYGNEYRMPVASPLQKAKTAVKAWMKRHGMDAKMTDADYDAIAASGLRRIRRTRIGDTGTESVDAATLNAEYDYYAEENRSLRDAETRRTEGEALQDNAESARRKSDFEAALNRDASIRGSEERNARRAEMEDYERQEDERKRKETEKEARLTDDELAELEKRLNAERGQVEKPMWDDYLAWIESTGRNNNAKSWNKFVMMNEWDPRLRIETGDNLRYNAKMLRIEEGEPSKRLPYDYGEEAAQREIGKWVSDYYEQREQLDSACAATDAAEAARRHAADAAKEQAKIDKMVADEEERQRILAEQEQMRKDAEHATQYGREMVADVLNGWYGRKGIGAEQVNRIVSGATQDEIRTILDSIEQEMDGRASDGTVLDIAKKVNADIVKRTVSEKQKEVRDKYVQDGKKRFQEMHRKDENDLDRFIESDVPRGIMAFIRYHGGVLMGKPSKYWTKNVRTQEKEWHFNDATAGDALDNFFNGMSKTEKQRWERIIFGYGAKAMNVAGGDVALDNLREWTGNESLTFEDVLDSLVKERAKYDEFLSNGRKTREDIHDEDLALLEAELEKDENAAKDAQSALDAETEAAWGDAVAMTADGKPVNSIDELKPTDGVPIGGEYLAVVEKDGDMVKLDADDGFGTTWTARFNKEKGEWDVETQDAADEGGQDRDRTEDRGDAEQDGSEGREGRDAGAAGGESGGNGAAAEAPSADTEGKVSIPIAIHEPRHGYGWYTNWRRSNGISESAHRSLGPNFDTLLAIARSKDTPQGKWRMAKDAGFGTRTMDEYVAALRADKFADGETRKAGAQSIVYRVGDKVVKFRDAEDFDGAEMDKVARHNELFPETAYTVKDIVDADGKRRIVLEQPYIDIVPNSGTEARRQLVKQLQERFGADNVKTSGDIGEKNLLAPKSWFKIDAGPWHIEDLKDLNIGIDRKDGNVKVWDAEIAYDAEKDAEGKAQGRWRRASKEESARLNNEPTIKVFRAMQVIDGKLYPPMAAKVDGKLVDDAKLGEWLIADERPDLAKNGKFTLNKGNGSSIAAAYNPYWHTSRSPLNDQFSSAYKRPNLVTVEVEVPVSELSSGYKADHAKDAVGEMSWHSGPVSSKLAKMGMERKVILSRYCKPIRVVDDAEVADTIAKMLKGKDISIPGNVVTPSLRAELEQRGVNVERDAQGRWRRPAVTPAEDAAYMDAVKRGDMETARRMVREAAAKAMPNTKVVDEDGLPLILTHGSYEDFNKFDKSKDKAKNYDIEGFYFLDARYGTYANRPIVKRVFLNLVNPLVAPIKTIIGKTSDGKNKIRVDNTLLQYQANGHYVEKDGKLIDIGRKNLVEEGYDGAIRYHEYIATAPYQIKSADPVTYDDAGNVIPLSERFNAEKSDIRWRRSAPSGRQKQSGVDYPDASNEIRAMWRRDGSFGKRAREEAKALILKKRPDFLGKNFVSSNIGDYINLPSDVQAEWESFGNNPWDNEKFLEWGAGKIIDRKLDEIGKFATPKEQKAALHWFIKGAIRLPEDAPKVTEAIKYGERAKGKANTDPMSYDSPMAMINALHEFKPKAKPINPDKVPQLSDKREMGNGVVTYLVQDDREGQQAMREIINTHWGEDANPWCLLHGDGYGHLSDGTNGCYDAWHYWNHYNALPKRVAFKDGKLLAFMATDAGDENYIGDDTLREMFPEYEDEYQSHITWYDGYESFMRKKHADVLRERGIDRVPEQWWDRQDASHEGIPLGNIPVPGDAFGRWADFEIRNGELVKIGRFYKGEGGEKGYIRWFDNGFIEKSLNGNVSKTFNEDGNLISYGVFNKKENSYSTSIEWDDDGRVDGWMFQFEGKDYDPKSKDGKEVAARIYRENSQKPANIPMFRRRTYTPNPAAQRLADLKRLTALEAAALAKMQNALGANDMAAATKAAREITMQGSVNAELKTLLDAMNGDGSGTMRKADLAKTFSSRMLDTTRTKLQDHQLALKKLEDALGISKEDSAYYQFDRNFGIERERMDDLDEQVMIPLGKELAKLNKTYARTIVSKDKHGNDVKHREDARGLLNMLLLAKHGANRNRMMAERSPFVLEAMTKRAARPIIDAVLNGTRDLDETTITEIGNALGWTREKTRKLEKGLRGSGASTAFWNKWLADNAAFARDAEPARQLVLKMNQMTRDELVRSGRLSAAQATEWERLSPDYVPMRSDMDVDSSLWAKVFLGVTGDGSAGGEEGHGYADNEFHHAYGRNDIADDPIAFSAQQYAAAVRRSLDNDARRKLADIVRNNAKLGKVFLYLSPAETNDLSRRVAILRNVAKSRALSVDEQDALNKMTARLAEANIGAGLIPTTKVLGANGVWHEVPNIRAIERDKENANDQRTPFVVFKENGDIKIIRLGGFTQEQVNADRNLLSDSDAKTIATQVKKQNLVHAFGADTMRKFTGVFAALRTAFSPYFVATNLLADRSQAKRNIYSTFGAEGEKKYRDYQFNSFGAARAVLMRREKGSAAFNGTKVHGHAKDWAENGGRIAGMAVENIRELGRKMDAAIRRSEGLSDRFKRLDLTSARDVFSFIKDAGVKVSDFVEYANSVVEMSTRIAAYATARDMGYSIADAVSYSRDITVNFNRKGEWTPTINAYIAFSNAGMQDLARSLEAFGEGEKLKGTLILGKRGGKMALKLAVFGFLAAFIGYWQDDEKDEREGKKQYKYNKEWEKANKMGIRVGDHIFGIPIRGLARIPYYFGHKAFEVMFANEKATSAAWDVSKLAMDTGYDVFGGSPTLLQAVTPSILKPVAELVENKDFSGRQIYREPLPGKEDVTVKSELGRSGTADGYKSAARMLNRMTGGTEYKPGAIDIQPEKLEKVLEWIGGTAARDVAQSAGFIKDLMTGEIKNRSVRNMPLVSRFVRSVGENSADYYEKRGEYEMARRTFDGAVGEGDTEAARESVAENPWLSSRGDGRRWGEELKTIASDIRELMKAEKTATGDKYERIHAQRLKSQYQFMRRLETPPKDDADGVRAERDHHRSVMPFLRSSKKEQKKDEHDKKKRKRLF